MKFGETFTEYLQTHQERFMEKCCYVEYKRLKKVLKNCRRCRARNDSSKANNGEEDGLSLCCQYESCPCDTNEMSWHNECHVSCWKKLLLPAPAAAKDTIEPLFQVFAMSLKPRSSKQMFFSELMKEASDIAGCLSSRVRRLVQLHVHNGMQRYFMLLRNCFASPQQATALECRMLIEYVMMNAVAMRKILKKYDKVHGSVNGMKFKSKMRAEHMEILHTPWLIELGAFYMNCNEFNGGELDGLVNPFSLNLSTIEPMMTLILPHSVELEYNLTCTICLELVFNPYALGCGHLFCKTCACSAASVMIFEGLKAASPESKCPVCREVGVYSNAVHMMELDLLLKKYCKEYWKERLVAERAEIVKQSKIHWEMQTKYMIGY